MFSFVSNFEGRFGNYLIFHNLFFINIAGKLAVFLPKLLVLTLSLKKTLVGLYYFIYTSEFFSTTYTEICKKKSKSYCSTIAGYKNVSSIYSIFKFLQRIILTFLAIFYQLLAKKLFSGNGTPYFTWVKL